MVTLYLTPKYIGDTIQFKGPSEVRARPDYIHMFIWDIKVHWIPPSFTDIMMFSIIRYTRKSVSLGSCRMPAASHVEWHRREHDSQRETETGRSDHKRHVCWWDDVPRSPAVHCVDLQQPGLLAAENTWLCR